MKTSVQIRNLSKSFGTTQVLKNLNFEIPDGQFVSLLGLSGSGKTTLLRCLAGLETPDYHSNTAIQVHGQYWIKGETALPPEKRRIGMVFQNYAVWPHLTVWENVAFPLQVARPRVAREEIALRVKRALDWVRLESLKDRKPHELSGGQQQRVALARALVFSPDLLLLDEPLSNLDVLLREELGFEIRRLQQSLGVTAILVTHDQREALALSDRVIVLHHGAIEADASPIDLFERPPTPFTAKFIAGAQTLKHPSSEPILVFPRKWHAAQGSEPAVRGSVHSRIYLGNEYEYQVTLDAPFTSDDPIRFYSRHVFEMGSPIALAIGHQTPDLHSLA